MIRPQLLREDSAANKDRIHAHRLRACNVVIQRVAHRKHPVLPELAVENRVARKLVRDGHGLAQSEDGASAFLYFLVGRKTPWHGAQLAAADSDQVWICADRRNPGFCWATSARIPRSSGMVLGVTPCPSGSVTPLTPCRRMKSALVVSSAPTGVSLSALDDEAVGSTAASGLMAPRAHQLMCRTLPRPSTPIGSVSFRRSRIKAWANSPEVTAPAKHVGTRGSLV